MQSGKETEMNPAGDGTPLALIAIFFQLVYYHSIGKNCGEWKGERNYGV